MAAFGPLVLPGSTAFGPLVLPGSTGWWVLALPGSTALWVLVLLVIGVVAFSAVELVGPDERRALTVFGSYRGVLAPGVALVPPFVSETHSFDATGQEVAVDADAVTRDGSAVAAEATVRFTVADVEQAFRGPEDLERAVRDVAGTALRSVVGDAASPAALDDRSGADGTPAVRDDGPDDRPGSVGVDLPAGRVEGVTETDVLAELDAEDATFEEVLEDALDPGTDLTTDDLLDAAVDAAGEGVTRETVLDAGRGPGDRRAVELAVREALDAEVDEWGVRIDGVSVEAIENRERTGEVEFEAVGER